MRSLTEHAGILFFCALIPACAGDHAPTPPHLVSAALPAEREARQGDGASNVADADDADDAHEGPWGPWSAPVNLGHLVNSSADDQHPAISRDNLSLYITSNRSGGHGNYDIWVARRRNVEDAWGQPVNLGSPINTGSSDFSPTFTPDGHWMYFNSDRTGPTACGKNDLYVSYRQNKHADFGWEKPRDLGYTINTSGDESGATYFRDRRTGVEALLFATRDRPGAVPPGGGDWDIYQSVRQADGSWGPGSIVHELSTPFRDTRTAISRDGLEIILSSNRPGDAATGLSAGSEDLWVSTRSSTRDTWAPPVNLDLANERLGGTKINSASFDGAPALSYDGTTLYFFSERSDPRASGKRDLYVTTRHRMPCRRDRCAE